jgi:hypothetical protein
MRMRVGHEDNLVLANLTYRHMTNAPGNQAPLRLGLHARNVAWALGERIGGGSVVIAGAGQDLARF